MAFSSMPTMLFNAKEIDKLLKDKFACIKLVKGAKKHIALHPFHLNDVTNGVKDVVNTGLKKYDKTLKGILVFYKNPKLLSNTGAILNESYYIHLDIQADFYLFCPEIGDTLRAIVNKKSVDHVGCLVHNIFNVSIPRPLDEEESNENWIGKNVEIGQEIFVNVVYTDFHHALPYIKAEFDMRYSENLLNTIRKTEEDSGISTSEEKKSKKKKIEIVDITTESITSKKHKKRKRKDENVDSHQNKKIRFNDSDNVINSNANNTVDDSYNDNSFIVPVEKETKRKKSKKKSSLNIEENINELLQPQQIKPEILSDASNSFISTDKKNKKLKKRKKSTVNENTEIDIEEHVNKSLDNQETLSKKNKKRSIDKNEVNIEENINKLLTEAQVYTSPQKTKPENKKHKKKSKEKTHNDFEEDCFDENIADCLEFYVDSPEEKVFSKNDLQTINTDVDFENKIDIYTIDMYTNDDDCIIPKKDETPVVKKKEKSNNKSPKKLNLSVNENEEQEQTPQEDSPKKSKKKKKKENSFNFEQVIVKEENVPASCLSDISDPLNEKSNLQDTDDVEKLRQLLLNSVSESILHPKKKKHRSGKSLEENTKSNKKKSKLNISAPSNFQTPMKDKNEFGSPAYTSTVVKKRTKKTKSSKVGSMKDFQNEMLEKYFGNSL